MRLGNIPRGPISALGGFAAAIMAVVFFGLAPARTVGGDHSWGFFHKHFGHKGELPPSPAGPASSGYWLWVRSPEQERVVVMGLYNRYCIRCHGVDGRGVWDIPGVPDFTNVRWQASRTD